MGSNNGRGTRWQMRRDSASLVRLGTSHDLESPTYPEIGVMNRMEDCGNWVDDAEMQSVLLFWNLPEMHFILALDCLLHGVEWLCFSDLSDAV